MKTPDIIWNLVIAMISLLLQLFFDIRDSMCMILSMKCLLPFQSLTSAKLLGVRVISQVGVIAVNSLLISSTLEPR